ncbi:MAG TPA: citramalate synthase, partial [Phycisphaerae bacterium]|nr:citramalate synthase [Phycisphaerae bacterium]
MANKQDTHGKRIEVYDTTLRDGSQGLGVSLSVQDKVLIAQALDTLGVDYIEGGYPLSNPKDAEFFQTVRGRRFTHAKMVAFGMTRRKGTAADQDEGLQSLLDSEAPVLAIVGKTSDLHIKDVLQVSREENLAMIAESIAMLVQAGREVFFDAEHFFDGYEANPDYAVKCLAAARDAGAARLVLCDTNGGSTLAQVARATARVVKDMPDSQIGIHCHNDCGLAVANTLMAVRHGAMHVQGTINGIGERCGNADLTAVLPNLALKYGYEVLRPGTLKNLTEVSRFVYEAANLNLLESQPFVGSAAFAHKGGMHV